MSWGTSTAAGVGVGGSYFGRPRESAAATSGETDLWEASGAADGGGTGAGVGAASTADCASPLAVAAAGAGGVDAVWAAAVAATMITRRDIGARFMVISYNET
jgi:hypothetical protein